MATPSTKPKLSTSARRTAMLGAMFLMATSAIGPGFITQTTEFTVRIGASFAFAIVVSILVDIAVQLNVWRIIGVSGLRAQELGNKVLPGIGWVLAALVFVGGLVFNIGNIAGTGLGINAMMGLDPKIGGIISAVVAILIFLSKRAGMALDKIVVLLGAIMILLMLYVAIVAAPPVGEALKNAVLPEQIDFLIITTLIGGTVGGYITYAGAHRMLDSGAAGVDNIKDITRTSILSIIVTGIMRVLLFLAILGVVAGGVVFDQQQQSRRGLRPRGRRHRHALLRRDPVGCRPDLRDRRRVHLGFLRHQVHHPGAHPQPDHRRVHLGLRRHLHVPGPGAADAADLRRRLQRADPARWLRGAALGRLATP